MAALEEHVPRAQGAEPPACLLLGTFVTDRQTGQPFRFGNVRCDKVGPRKKQFHKGLYRGVINQAASPLGDHHRVQHQDLLVVQGKFLRQDLDDRGRKEHAGLHHIDRNIAEDRIELLRNERGRNPVDGSDPQGILGRKGRQDRRRVPSQKGDGLYIRLDPGAAAGIAPGHGEDRTPWKRKPPVEEEGQFGGSQARFRARQHCRDNGDGVGSGVDDPGGVVPGDAADGNHGDAHMLSHLGKDSRAGEIPHILALRGIHGAETDIVRTLGFGPQGLLHGVGGNADDRVRPEDPARLSDTAVLLAQVDTVGTEFGGKGEIIIDDERNATADTEDLQLPSLFAARRLVRGLVPVLKTGDPAGECTLHPFQEPIVVVGYEIKAFHHCFLRYGVLHFSGRGKQRP